MEKSSFLSGSKVSLGIIGDGDRENMLDILTNEEVGLTYLLPRFAQRRDALPLFDRLKTFSENPSRFVYGICRQDRLIGWINEVEIQGSEIEVGYVIHPEYKNQGFATDALSLAITELFRLGFTAVKAAAFEENIPSMRVMEKNGMIRTGETETLEYRGLIRRCICYKRKQ